MPTPQGFPGSLFEDVSRFNFSPQGFKQYAFIDPVNFYRVFLFNVLYSLVCKQEWRPDGVALSCGRQFLSLRDYLQVRHYHLYVFFIYI